MIQKNDSNEHLKIRKPQLSDGSSIYELVKVSKPLDVNSLYSYLLICSHFNDTSAVVEGKDDIIGYISAYPNPHQDNTLFIWQVAVHPRERGRGLAKSMIMDILDRDELKKTRYLEATVTPSNKASEALFKKMASDLGVECQVSNFFHSSLFGETYHEEESLLRIGPLNK